MRRCTPFLSVAFFALAGCMDSSPSADSGRSSTSDSASQGTSAASTLDTFVLRDKPAKAVSVRDALNAKDGDRIVVSGRTPPENVKPFNSAVAAFILMAPEDLAREEVRDEFECEEAATCPACKKMLDKYAIRVELVDDAGAVIGTSLEGYRGLKPGTLITVEGEVKRDGKDKKLVRVVAKKFYPG